MRSVLASELYSIIVGFDIGNVLQATINGIITTIGHIPLILYTDSYLLYDYIVKLRSTIEKRLIIDIIGLR